MPRIRGIGLGSGMAIGTAAVVRERNGIPLPPSIPDRIAVQIATHRLAETPEVVLVARDYATALALYSTITWAKVAAIAAETAPPNAPVPPVPAVVNLPGLVDMVQDDVLVLVDASSNFVFPDPDPMYLAQYTAEHDRVVPKRRICLDEAHYPAQTVDAQVVQVFALISSDLEAEVIVAMQQGADGLFLPSGSALHRAPENAQRNQMFAMIQEASGKPIILADMEALPAMLLCEASAEADVTVAMPGREKSNGLLLSELRSEFERIELSCFDNDLPAGIPRLAALIGSLSQTEVGLETVEHWIEETAASGAARAVFSLDNDSLSEGVLVELENYLAACARNLLPTYVSASNYAFNLFGQNNLENTLETAIQLLVGAHVTGIIVDPDHVEAAKRCICELDAEECRQRYWSVLQMARAE